MYTLSILTLSLVLLHPNSLSSSRIQVQGATAILTLRCQGLSFLEVIDGLDADGDGAVSADETANREGEILEYVARHYRLTAGSDRSLQGGVPLRAEPVSVTHLPESLDGPVPFLRGRVDVKLRYHAEAPIRDLLIEVSLFRDTSPDHVDLATIEWEGHEPDSFGLTPRSPSVRADPTGHGAFQAFLGLGFHHILGGWDHLLFVAALILASRRLKALLFVVTAFTLAHSVTLALSAIGVVDLSAHTRVVEAVIALSIAYVAVDNLLRPELRRSRWIEAFVFGLVHGLGFAGFLAASLVNEKAKGMALFSFNLGVEAGQILVVLIVVAPLTLLFGRHQKENEFLAPRPLRIGGSVVTAAFGLFWFFQRI